MPSRKTLEGRPTIFRRTAADEQDTETAGQPDVQPARQQRIKATFYLEPADIMAIDQMQTQEFAATGKKPERSHVVSWAIQALFNQRNSQPSEQPDS